MSELFLIFVFTTALSAIFTLGVRALVLQWHVLDVPNKRSSHHCPTPTLGGVGIVLGVWGGVVLGRVLFDLPHASFINALGFSSLITLLLIYDEIHPLSRISKLLIQLISSVGLVWAGVVLHRIELPLLGEVNFDWLAYPVTLFWFLAMQNIYNFMDGIDGIAGTEGMLVSLLIGGLAIFVVPSLAPLCVVVAGAILGFLFFNFPPAKIFMGDVGSHFLGLSFAAIAVWGEGQNLPFWITVLFLGIFLFDTSYTLFRRFMRGENLTRAHREHLYQRLNRMKWSHLRINIWFGGYTLMLGLVGYLYMFEFGGFAVWVFGICAILIITGTICVEFYWRTAKQ